MILILGSIEFSTCEVLLQECNEKIKKNPTKG